MKKSNLFHYGIIFYGFMLMFFIYTIIKTLHSMFLVPVTESLGMERSEFSLLFTISGISVAFALPVITKLLKKYPARLVIAVCILMAGGGFAAFSLARASWQFYLISAIVGAGTGGCTQMVGSLLINNWFEDRRGLALGIAFTGSGFGTAVLSPLLTNLLANYGWQFSYVTMGALIVLFCLPLTFLFGYKTPAERNAEPYRDAKKAAVEQKEKTTSKTVTGPLLQDVRGKSFFWIFLIAICLWSMAIGGVHLHIAAYLTDVGHSASFVAFVYSVMAASIIVAKILLGMIFDIKGSRAGILFMSITFVTAMICLILAQNPVLAVLFVFVYSCGSIFTSVGLPYITSSYFGQRSYADILSTVNIAYVVGASSGPFISGLMFDITGSYQLIWRIYLAIFIVAVMTVLLLKPYLDKKYQKEWFETD